MSKLKVCPFCGGKAEAQTWQGGPPTRTFISCGNEDCPVHPDTIGDTFKEALKNWNTRRK